MFGENVGEDFAEEMDITFLGDLPLTPKVADSANLGKSMVSLNSNAEVGKEFMDIAKKIDDEFLNKED